MKAVFSAMEISEALEKSKRHVRMLAKKENWPFKEVPNDKGGGIKRLYFFDSLPKHIQIALSIWTNKQESSALMPSNSALPTPNTIEKNQPPLSKKEEETAFAKADLLRFYMDTQAKAPWGKKRVKCDELLLAYNSGQAYPKLFEIIGTVDYKTIEGWEQRLNKNDGDTRCLADRRGYVRRGSCIVTEEQARILVRCALNPNRLKISEVIRVCRAIMNTKGIVNHASDGTYRNFFKSWKSKHYDVWVFNREGAKAWNDKVAFYIERDYNLINVGDVLVADGHTLNFEIINPWTGKLKRMILILWFDMKSSFPLGWEIMPTENTQAIASALRRAILRLGKYPKVAYMDNGKAFGARFFKGIDFEQEGFSGLFSRLNMKTIYAWPYHAQSKTVERFFGTFGELERLSPTYVGTSIDKQPPRLKRGEKLHQKVYEKRMQGWGISLEMAHKAIAAWLDEYVQRPQRGHLEGKTPLEVFVEGRGPGVDPLELRGLMMSSEVRTITRNGIRFLGEHYYDPALHGRKHSAVIRYDLQDKSAILVYDKGGEFICEARSMDKVHPAATALGNDEDKARLREQIEMKQGQKKAASASAKAFLEDEILPEHQRHMESMGFLPDPQNTSVINEKKNLEKSTQDSIYDRVNVEAELKERERWKQEDLENQIARKFERISKMRDGDRYDALAEIEVEGKLEIPDEHKDFMKFYEQTEEYFYSKHYHDEFRERWVNYYQRQAANG